MRDPQVTMGKKCKTMLKWSSMTWMIWGTPIDWKPPFIPAICGATKRKLSL